MSDKMKKSIRNKLMSMSVTVAFIAIVLLSIVSWKGFTDMKNSSEIMSENLVNVATENSQKIITEQAIDELNSIAKSTSSTVDARIQAIMDEATILAKTIEDLYANPDDYGQKEIFPPDAKNTNIFTSQLVYSEHTDKNEVQDEVLLLGNVTSMMNNTCEFLPGASSVHVGTESGFIIMSDERSDLKIDLDYIEYTTRSWYTLSVGQNSSTWTEVFEDAYGRGLAITCSHPIYDPLGELKAVVAIGCQLSEISSIITDVAIGQTGHAIVVDNYGDVIMGKQFLQSEDGIVEEKDNFFNSADEQLLEATHNMIEGNSGIIMLDINGESVFLSYHPLASMPWSVVTLISVDEVLEPVMKGKEQTSNLAILAQQEADKISSSTLIAMIAGMTASAVAALLVGLLYSNKLASPIRKLEAGVREIAKGKLEGRLEIKTGDEIENLAEAFNIMTTDLKNHILELTNITAEKEKIGAELNVATQIQSSMLPSDFDTFKEYSEFDIHASMIPAKEVGGDFYDFFLVDDRHLGVVIADVSGKGVPAALFMVIAKTLIKNHAQKGESPSDILAHTNNQLNQNNDALMFVTAWIGILNIDTGEMIYSNAGHNPPLIKHNNGDFEYLQCDTNFIIAGLEDIEYTQSSINLKQGDILYLYTDGVTEATNSNKELYSEERLLEKMNNLDTYSLKTMIENIKNDIDVFVGDAPQHDDITMLILRFRCEK